MSQEWREIHAVAANDLPYALHTFLSPEDTTKS